MNLTDAFAASQDLRPKFTDDDPLGLKLFEGSWARVSHDKGATGRAKSVTSRVSRFKRQRTVRHARQRTGDTTPLHVGSFTLIEEDDPLEAFLPSHGAWALTMVCSCPLPGPCSCACLHE